MVQGTSSYDYTSSRVSNAAASWEKPSAKRTGYDAIQRMDKEKQKKAAESDKYGAWGPTFKNKEHFANMHHC